LKPYQFQDITAFRGLESPIKMGRNITNIEIRLSVVTVEVRNIFVIEINFITEFCGTLTKTM
jgi:hypothetical protein